MIGPAVPSGSTKTAAVGFRVHSGWTALVALAVKKGTPVVLARERVHLVRTFTYEFRQPYHTAEKMPAGEAGGVISRANAEARRLAFRAISGLKTSLQAQGYELTRCGLLLASGRALPNLSKILASHSLIHSADGELFREALLDASARCHLKIATFKEKEFLDSAAKTLHLKPSNLMRRITDLGCPLGPPWSQDEKFASLAAWLAALS
ncbi:MAG: hypothetical protein ABSG27_08285 [Candidatus Acidiferrales bacterium]|jgi:hypothetical protein